MVKITLEKHIFPKFPRFFFLTKTTQNSLPKQRRLPTPVDAMPIEVVNAGSGSSPAEAPYCRQYK